MFQSHLCAFELFYAFGKKKNALEVNKTTCTSVEEKIIQQSVKVVAVDQTPVHFLTGK